MRFFEQQRIARERTAYLVFLFIVAVSAVAFITAAVMTFVWYHTFGLAVLVTHAKIQKTFSEIFFTTAFTIAGASFIRLLFPSSGSSVALSLGGQLLPRTTTDQDARKLLNVVEEMSIASGVPVPPVYVMARDNSINAFAAGSDSFHAVIAVTQGAMTVLTREELQGVIGHEFSHILNNDLKLNLRVTSTIFGLMMIANTGRFLMRIDTDCDEADKRYSGYLSALGFALFVMGYFGVFFARIIQSAISRQREYLADASATQFTRNPLGLASALGKIQYFSGSLISSGRNYEMDHYFFASAVSSGFFNSIFSTHPPIEKRIKEIYPQFNHSEFAAEIFKKKEVQEYFEELESHRQKYSTESFREEKLGDGAKLAFQSIANPTALHLGFAKKVVADIPSETNMAALSVFGALNIIWSVLLSFQNKISTQNLLDNDLIKLSDKEEIENYLKWLKLNLHTHTALLSMALASLHVLPVYEKKNIEAKFKKLFLLDGDFSFLEMLIYIYVMKILYAPDKTDSINAVTVNALRISKDIEKVTVWVIFFNSRISTKEERKNKYIQAIFNMIPAPSDYEDIASLTLEDLHLSTESLSKLNLVEKGKLIRILFDLTDREDAFQTEALRFLCGLLHVPVPPILVYNKALRAE
ncbi:MAG: M48 family metallopeptidase [Bdellovibrio sp.]